MLLDRETFRQAHEKDDYAQLINIKAELMSEIMAYENRIKSGGYSCEELEMRPRPYDIYMANLDYLKIILELMENKCKCDTFMVDTDNPVETINYYNAILWNSSEHFVTNNMRNMAIKLLNKLADDNVPEAMNDKGAMYFEGVNYKQDYKKAAYWYKKAAEVGNSQAMSNLGYMYFYGQGIKQSYEKAHKFFSMASMHNHPEGLNKLGDMYRNGLYVMQNYDIAMQCYIRANNVASKNKMSDAYPANLVRIAEMCMDGCLGWVDVRKAKEMLLEAKEILEKQLVERSTYAKPVLERVNKDLEKIEKMFTES